VSNPSCGAGHTTSHARTRVPRAIPPPHTRRQDLNRHNLAADDTKEANRAKQL
jgi:hypothetical protein